MLLTFQHAIRFPFIAHVRVQCRVYRRSNFPPLLADDLCCEYQHIDELSNYRKYLLSIPADDEIVINLDQHCLSIDSKHRKESLGSNIDDYFLLFF